LFCSTDLPVTLQGGEPSLHPDFFWIIKNIRSDINIDILTNLTFDIKQFIHEINPSRLSRKAKYPNIRVSYHPEYMELNSLIQKVLEMQDAGFSIGVYGVMHPLLLLKMEEAGLACRKVGIDFRTKEFLGEHDNLLYGNYLYKNAVGNDKRKRCLCRSTDLIIGPTAEVFRCHHDLYKNFPAIGSLLDNNIELTYSFRECSEFGDCNPCDIKVKTNRFQIFGHTSVEIKNV